MIVILCFWVDIFMTWRYLAVGSELTCPAKKKHAIQPEHMWFMWSNRNFRFEPQAKSIKKHYKIGVQVHKLVGRAKASESMIIDDSTVAFQEPFLLCAHRAFRASNHADSKNCLINLQFLWKHEVSDFALLQNLVECKACSFISFPEWIDSSTSCTRFFHCQAPTCSPVGRCARSSCTFDSVWSDRLKTHRNKVTKKQTNTNKTNKTNAETVLKFRKPETTAAMGAMSKWEWDFGRISLWHTLTNRVATLATCTSGPVRTMSCRSIPES